MISVQDAWKAKIQPGKVSVIKKPGLLMQTGQEDKVNIQVKPAF